MPGYRFVRLLFVVFIVVAYGTDVISGLFGKSGMRIPNADHAVVEVRKLTDYCLSLEHPRGQHKARVFRSALGITNIHARDLRDELLRRIKVEECVVAGSDAYGTRYVVDFLYRRGEKKAVVRSAWIIKPDEQYPRLTSCFVL